MASFRQRRGRREDRYDARIIGERVEDVDDKVNIATLLGLYLLQGIPLGLSAAIPLYLQTKTVSYGDQAKFSLVNWPFSLKLLWAPIVDSVYFARMGRRKSWLVPCQYFMAIFMLFLSYNVDSWIGNSQSEPDIFRLTFYFFLLNLLAATQDIVVDGWALTMLSRSNVAYASTCNSVGQTAGYFLGYVIFLALDSPDFCNRFVRSTPRPVGIVSLPEFLHFWGVVFFITTTLILIFKKERPPRRMRDEQRRMTLVEAYKLLWVIIKLPAVRVYILVLLTSKIAFGACDGVTSLKLLESGVTKELLAGMAVLALPVQIILPLVINKFLVGPRPMSLYVQAIPYRLVLSLSAILVVRLAPYSKSEGWGSVLYYACLMVLYLSIQVPINVMYVASMAFFARISDPAVGGTYMTLLNTVSNFGGNWPATMALWFVDILTFKSCSGFHDLPCGTKDDLKVCTYHGGTCETKFDGYEVESVICFLIGWFWLWIAGRKAVLLQRRRPEEWAIVHPETWFEPVALPETGTLPVPLPGFIDSDSDSDPDPEPEGGE